MLTLFSSFMVPVILVLIFKFLNKRPNPPILGIYQRPKKLYWLKFVLVYIGLRVVQLVNYLKKMAAVESGKSADGTTHVHKQEDDLEQMISIAGSPMGVDGVLFNGVSRKGQIVLCKIARRAKHFCDAFLYLKLDDKTVLLSPSLPDTYLEQSESDGDDYSVQGLVFERFIPMRTWHVSYKGDMKQKDNEETKVKVDMNLTWSAHLPPFKFNTQISPLTLAESVAKESWSKDYFKLVKRLQQVHYEQMGFIEGTVKIDENEYTLKMPCVRDRTFAKYRDWRNYHRYVYHTIHLENGDFIAVGAVSKPVLFSHFTVGFICRMSNQTVYAVDSSDFLLYQHGENRILPKEYAFSFRADGQSHTVHIEIKEENIIYFGKHREAKLYQRWCSADVDGLKGWGYVDWCYNNTNDLTKY